MPTATEEECAETNPDTGSAFTFWYADLVTFHVWAWMQNPDGLYNGTNPLMSAHNDGRHLLDRGLSEGRRRERRADDVRVLGVDLLQMG